MPIYEFRCGSCGEMFEELVMGSSKEEPQPCPACGHEHTQRVMSGFSTSSSSESACAARGTPACGSSGFN